ncbi:hypothetical protein B0H34DRAFT_664170, partial [Crassisporium funariophilum]
DEREDMLQEDEAMLEGDLVPIRLMLVKLQNISNTIKNSSTILLPEWFKILKDLRLKACMMPQDVLTHWNSTFDMLNFAVK